MSLVKQNQAVIWVQEEKFGSFSPLAIGEEGSGATGKGISLLDLAPVFGRDRFGRAKLLSIAESPPGDLPSLTLTMFEQDTLNYLERLIQQGCPVNLQIRYVTCGILDNPAIWSKMQNWGDGQLTAYNPGDGPTETFSGENMTVAGTLSFVSLSVLVTNVLSSQTTVETENINAIDGIEDLDCGDCGTGYPGADRLLIAGADAVGAGIANVLITTNGGGVWTVTATDPFGVDEHVIGVAVNQIEADKARYIVANSAAAEIAWADVTYGDELNTTWTVIAGTGAATEALEWLRFETLYVATDGDVYISTDQGASIPATAAYAGANVINGFSISVDTKDVYAFGASNTILLEQNKAGSFAARVGPSGGGAFTAVTLAEDGTLWAGNGTSIFRTSNKAANAGGWTSVKDFGANMSVVAINCINGNSQLLRVIVDNSAGAGAVWETIDGGNSWRQLAAVSNSGYNDAYFSEINNNLGVVVGDADGGLGVIQQIAAE